MPSVPRPAFYTPANVARGPTPRQRQSDVQAMDNFSNQSTLSLPPLVLPDYSSPVDLESTSPLSRSSSRSESPKVMRGPWDHSGCISVPLDVENILTPLKPVAVSPKAGW